MIAARKDKRKAKAEVEAQVADVAEQRLAAAKTQRVENKQLGIKAGMKVGESQVADHAIACFFYANAIPFGAADLATDSLYQIMVRAIQAAPPDVRAPQ